ncbi:TLD domain-containing protein 1-like isoform X3 [Limulus polyphemus]|uniref:MTOR-associated protein MEAK7 n=1 Tax=Limulus polyphemus TaxID=6850 RepID=A0ABM1SSG7_LIMPO|nr:TLD domain-containing protein 1-like isoform X3 [Limulus polyphemus]
MGAQPSKDLELEEYLSYFSLEERAKLEQTFKQILGEKCDSAIDCFNLDQLHRHLEPFLPALMIERLHDEMANVLNKSESHNRLVNYRSFVAAMAHLLKGNVHEKSHIVRRLATERKDSVSSPELLKFVEEMLSAFILIITDTPQFISWRLGVTEASTEHLSLLLLHDLLYKDYPHTDVQHQHVSDQVYTETDIEIWLTKCSLMVMVLEMVFRACFKVLSESSLQEAAASQSQNYGFQPLPFCVGVDWKRFKTLLDIPSVLLLNSHIPPAYRSTWHLLFSSNVHGESFSSMLTRVVCQGPSILLVRDKNGYVFGGFASEAWEPSTKFSGTADSFVFTLVPRMGVYLATGYNSNFMYLAVNQQTFPNGMGLGGQLNNFGIWLDANFDHGHSTAGCTTFNSPQLSAESHFRVDVVEVWRIGPEVVKDKQRLDPSILDIDPEAKAMLSLINKGPVSEGLREKDPMADMPEEKNLLPL